ncbi:MAG: MutH/Sau3AI family endonuclease [Myxococcales bacterium]|nr:DNA mismatch repair protein MutH [Myxococcales bacterium]
MEPPRDEAELRERLGRLAGRRLIDLAADHGVALKANKGWAGMLVEKALGATAASRAEPDFPRLGIELKTIPIDERGRPIESCFVASLDLGTFDLRWETSPVRKKLERVAWVPVEAFGERRCGIAFLWSPSDEERSTLQGDYEDIVDLLGVGARVTARTGTWLQLRPKGRDSRHLRWALDEEGGLSRAPPRAFYLRRSFTAALLAAR